jgi:hypothetical protein
MGSPLSISQRATTHAHALTFPPALGGAVSPDFPGEPETAVPAPDRGACSGFSEEATASDRLAMNGMAAQLAADVNSRPPLAGQKPRLIG